jgi:hypothetical protein
MNAIIRFPEFRSKAPSLHFTRAEFNRLISLYSNRVMAGEWRDYAFSFGPTKANFFIFRHSFENPLFVISKLDSRKEGRKGRFLVSSRGQKLSQCHTLEDALAVFSKPMRLVSP